jgi:hypothetical protein
MAVNGPGCHPQNFIWTKAKLRSIYYFMGDRPVHKLPFAQKCHELFAILYSILASLSDDMFFYYCISKTKNEFGQNPEENIILNGPGQYTKIFTGSLTKTNKNNIIVKYNICKCNSQKYLIIPN